MDKCAKYCLVKCKGLVCSNLGFLYCDTMLQSDMQALYFTHLKVWIAWRWRHCVSLKRYLCSILRHIAIIQNATIWIFTAMKTSVLMVCILPLVSVDLCVMQSWSLLNVSKIGVRLNMQVTLTLRWLMSYIYIYGAPILDVSRSHTTTQHSR